MYWSVSHWLVWVCLLCRSDLDLDLDLDGFPSNRPMLVFNRRGLGLRLFKLNVSLLVSFGHFS